MDVLSLATRESFDSVMKKYTPTVYGIAYTRLHSPVDAEDVTQDVFVRYFKADITYESEEHRKAWLIRCAVNCTNSYAKSAQYRHRSESVNLDDVAELPSAYNTAEHTERTERKNAVLNAVAMLPPKYRTVVHLYYFEDMSVAEIAEVVGERQSTVKTRLSRARDKLKALLKGEVEF